LEGAAADSRFGLRLTRPPTGPAGGARVGAHWFNNTCNSLLLTVVAH
jgi:hypothetical protein